MKGYLIIHNTRPPSLPHLLIKDERLLMETRWKDTYVRLSTAPISGPGIKEEVLYLRAEAEALQGLIYLLLPSRYGLKIAGDVFKIFLTWMTKISQSMILSVRFVREPVRSRERDTRTQKEILKEREMEEEEKEIKRAARKAEEKELIYQVQLSSVPFTFAPLLL